MQTRLQKEVAKRITSHQELFFNKSLMSTILEVDKFDCKCKHGCKKKWPKD
jgi:hypothetical protein